jgi:hypothetical protein
MSTNFRIYVLTSVVKTSLSSASPYRLTSGLILCPQKLHCLETGTDVVFSVTFPANNFLKLHIPALKLISEDSGYKVLSLMRSIVELVGICWGGLDYGRFSRDPFREGWSTYRMIWEINRMLEDTSGWECSTRLGWM